MFVITDVKQHIIILRCAYKEFHTKFHMVTVLLGRINGNLLLSRA